MVKSGVETVSSEGQMEKAFPFQPQTVKVEFIDQDPDDVRPSCAPPEEPDWVKIDLALLSGGRWGFRIKWHVHGTKPRKIQWVARDS